MLKSPLGRLRVVGCVEGVSFLLLLGVAMPLRKWAGMPEAVKVAGWVHGVLWMLMLAAVADVARRRRWPAKRIAAAVAASVLPGGPFVLDRTLKQEQKAVEAGL